MGSRVFLVAALLVLGLAPTRTSAVDVPVRIPLKHVVAWGEGSDPDQLGIMVGLNDGPPRLLQFDTGSDAVNIQDYRDVPGVAPVPGAEPEMYAYGDGSYGYWQREIRFESMSFYDPERPGRPVATFGGGHVANQVLDMVYTKDYHAFAGKKLSRDPVGEDGDGNALYADLDYRRKMQAGEPGEVDAFYGTFGASDSIGSEVVSSPLGGRTRSGYVVAANANLDGRKTPGCAPCLVVHLTPAIRSQFTALVPWGDPGRGGGNYRDRFPRSGANASRMYEGAYPYTITFDAGKGARKVDFKGPLLLDTGTVEFAFLSAENVLKRLASRGYPLGEGEDGEVDFSIRGSDHAYDQLDFSGVDIHRLDNEDTGDGLTLGLPFFQSNTVMYDLENRTTAYSPFFVSVEEFTTDGSGGSGIRLSHLTGEMGSSGWFGLAGPVSGSGGLRIGTGAVVRMTGVNTYTGPTVVEKDASLYLAGPGDIRHSAGVVVDGTLNVEQKGGYVASWGVAGPDDPVVIRDLSGTGSVYIGDRRLVVMAAGGRFSGQIGDVDDDGNSLQGSVAVLAGQLELAGDNSYTGLTEVGRGARLHLTGSLAGDVSVSGTLVVDGEVSGKVTVESGGLLAGAGNVDDVVIAAGGRSELKPSPGRR